MRSYPRLPGKKVVCDFSSWNKSRKEIKYAALVFLIGVLQLNAQNIDCSELRQAYEKERNIEQVDNYNTDPTKYIEVYEVNPNKLTKRYKPRLLWKFEEKPQKAEKQVKIIDKDSDIKIRFKKEALQNNTWFSGNISIVGNLSSNKESDPVEVLPFSLIGEDELGIGTSFLPPFEISRTFVNLFLESLNALDDASKVNFDEVNYRKKIRDLELLSEEYQKLESSTQLARVDDSKRPPILKSNSINSINKSILGLKLNLKTPVLEDLDSSSPAPVTQNRKKQLQKEVDSITKNLKFEFESKLRMLYDGIDNFNSRLDLIASYIKNFRLSGEKAEEAFLSLSSLDRTVLANIDANLESIHIELDKLLREGSNSSTKNGFIVETVESKKINDEIKLLYQRGLEYVERLENMQGSQIDRFLFCDQEYDQNRYKNYEMVREALFRNRIPLINFLSVRSSIILYKELKTATVNLRKERAEEGNTLNLYAILEKKQKDPISGEITNDRQKVPIGSYEIRETGWKTKIADSFILVNRINEPDQATNSNETDSEDSNLSPSNFKGAPGVSLLLTRNNSGYENESFLNALEPSFGLNVSYLDFNTQDDVEIGAGLMFGLFRNKLFFTWGINLNATGSGEEDPFYFGVGFSFANIAGKLFKKEE
ncbi:hypothetical protein [Maribacter sp. 2304DJ31-5]|uniref:hypothetical protein n=1 Tax=Maribacter sp. 2304DJ31-5 TaxID=3386273 RepID=UPI0039BC42A1